MIENFSKEVRMVMGGLLGAGVGLVHGASRISVDTPDRPNRRDFLRLCLEVGVGLVGGAMIGAVEIKKTND